VARQPLLGDVDLDGQQEPLRERLERRAQAPLGQDRRVQAAGELAQLVEPDLELAHGVVQQRARHLRPGGELRPREAQLQRHGDERLLRAVVEVALQAPALLVADHHQPGAGGDEIGARLGARHRQRDELAERGEAVLGLGRQRVLAADRDRAPQVPADDDRRRRRRAVAALEHRLGGLPREHAPVVHPRGRLPAQHLADRRVLLGLQRAADAEDVDAVAVVAPHDRRGPVVLVAHDDRRVDVEDERALLRHRHEHLLRRRLGRDERRDPPQGPLLPREADHLLELVVGVRGQRALAALVAGGAVRQIDPGGDEGDLDTVGVEHRLVRPGDETAAAVLRHPVADLRARGRRRPHVLQELAVGLALLGRDDDVARVAPDDLLAREARRALAGLVEEQDPAVAVVHADERLRGLGQDPRERVADDEFGVLRRLGHWRAGRILETEGCAQGGAA
jgi:hypothetical protein